MSISKEIVSHLPYLRRFSYALNGTQIAGDAYIVATLEALIADPAVFQKNIPPRHAIYKMFLKLWSSTNGNLKPLIAMPEPLAVEHDLEALTPLIRSAFLLWAVEGFAVNEVASILDIAPVAAAKLINKAGRGMSEQTLNEVIIIESETVISQFT
jgi:hypothetical protein